MADTGDCAFCRIANGDEPATVVFEDAESLAFLDNRPLFPGHSLLIPRAHHETLADLPDELAATIFLNVRLLSRAVPDAMGKPGSFVALNNVVSQSVPHLHVHVVPGAEGRLARLLLARTKYASEAEMKKVAASVRKAVGRYL